MARKPMPPQPIVTKELPRICPACAHKELGRVDNFGVYRLTCMRCNWHELYRVRP